MSIRGAIIVHQCDGCLTVEIVNLDHGAAAFDNHWYLGVHVDFRPTCSVNPVHADLIANEQLVWQTVADRIATAVAARIRQIDEEVSTNVH